MISILMVTDSDLDQLYEVSDRIEYLISQTQVNGLYQKRFIVGNFIRMAENSKIKDIQCPQYSEDLLRYYSLNDLNSIVELYQMFKYGMTGSSRKKINVIKFILYIQEFFIYDSVIVRFNIPKIQELV